MTYKHFSINIIIQACFIALTPVVIAYIWSSDSLLLLRNLLFIVYGIQVWNLIYSVRKTNRELAKFIQSFGFGDTTIHFHNQDKDVSFGDLFKAFNQVVGSFRQLKIDKEKEYLFFENALKNLGVAIVVVNEHGNVLMTNDALLKMLNIKYLHRLEKLNGFKSGLAIELLKLQPNQQKLVELIVDGRLLQVALTSVLMKQEQKTLRLLAFQDIRSEIEEKELESWQKLIRVLTHEVMNSLSPVNILSASLMQRFNPENKSIELNQDEQQEIHEALDAIHSRSKGLTRFVESYRSMAGLKSAQTAACNINALLSRIQVLFQSEMKADNISLEIRIEDKIEHQIDEKLVEQVLINLVKNSREALSNKGKIVLRATKENLGLIISVSDNGKGIPKDELDKVCVPFYTTRKGGNGIGLALSRQVMRLHGGQLKIQSEEGEGTEVSLQF
ncbi:sensor histidine kinase [Carboxylicivirga sp. N1Y90]|uniref:sensor histidine kinase n=1 Tax=Carboxylicivirga fragile TaxID=3417571 RepID=UPI003D338030|nr:ATP-binding protein [Marinilabiliaceae bacterium N1Y90]